MRTSSDKKTTGHHDEQQYDCGCCAGHWCLGRYELEQKRNEEHRELGVRRFGRKPCLNACQPDRVADTRMSGF